MGSGARKKNSGNFSASIRNFNINEERRNIFGIGKSIQKYYINIKIVIIFV